MVERRRYCLGCGKDATYGNQCDCPCGQAVETDESFRERTTAKSMTPEEVTDAERRLVEGGWDGVEVESLILSVRSRMAIQANLERECGELRGAYASALRAADKIRHDLEIERAYSNRLYSRLCGYEDPPHRGDVDSKAGA
jgi:hypothetical protein